MAYLTRHLSPQHRSDILRLWKENMSDRRIADVLEQRFSWLYERNPAGPANTVIAVQDTGTVVGCGSLYPRRMVLAGSDVNAGIPADFAVDRSHRLGGAASMIQRALLADGARSVEFVFGFPNRSSLPILQRVGYKVIAEAQSWVKPLSVGYKLKSYVGSERVAALVGFPADMALAAIDGWRSAGLKRRRTPEVTDRADERFDALWRRARQSYALTGERSAAYLNWRYAEFTTKRHRFFCLSDRTSGALLGYAVFSVVDGKAFVDDMFGIDMAETAEELMLMLARYLRAEGAHSVAVVYAGGADLGERLRRLGFHLRGGARKLVAKADGLSAAQQETLFDSCRWHLFDGEMDI